MTSNLDVRRAMVDLLDLGFEVGGGAFTGVEEGNGVVDSFFRVGLEDFFHVRERGIPFQCVAEVSVCAHDAEVAT